LNIYNSKKRLFTIWTY